jgi:outer membrane protein OmpA-like peptidoglycan-associated protein
MLDRACKQGQRKDGSIPDSNTASDVSSMHSATRTIIAAISLAALASGCAAPSPSPSPSPSPIPNRLPSIRFESIRFESGQSALSSTARQSIREAAALLKNGPVSTLPVIVEGHSDSSGDAAANERLSKVRAQSVANELVFNGIAPERITVRGYGDSRPVAPDKHPDGTDNPEGRSRNRRVDVTIDSRPDGVGVRPRSSSL